MTVTTNYEEMKHLMIQKNIEATTKYTLPKGWLTGITHFTCDILEAMFPTEFNEEDFRKELVATYVKSVGGGAA